MSIHRAKVYDDIDGRLVKDIRINCDIDYCKVPDEAPLVIGPDYTLMLKDCPEPYCSLCGRLLPDTRWHRMTLEEEVPEYFSYCPACYDYLFPPLDGKLSAWDWIKQFRWLR